MNLTYIVLAAATVVSNLLSMILQYPFLIEILFIQDMWHKYVNICSLIVYYLTKTWNNFTWQSIWNQRFICKILIAIINESESVAPAYGDDPKEHEDHCRYTVKNRGSRRNRKCAFPFRFEGKLFEGICTNITVAQEYMFKVRTKIKYRIAIFLL